MGALALGKSIDSCVEIGHRMGAICVGQVGPQWASSGVDVLTGL